MISTIYILLIVLPSKLVMIKTILKSQKCIDQIPKFLLRRMKEIEFTLDKFIKHCRDFYSRCVYCENRAKHTTLVNDCHTDHID